MKHDETLDPESVRLRDDARRERNWKRWGPYLSERQWGTVREDYSPDGSAWNYLPHDHARSRAYRWGEDGLAGISDRHQFVCFALALWNGRDPILKERLFGLSGPEGNHGEDVKEYYYYLDSTPTHSYMRYLYKYPQAEFPYNALVAENKRRGRRELEYELMDTGVFDEDRYFDVFVTYAKGSSEDLLVVIDVANRGPDPAPLDVLPTVWFRNTWASGLDARRPRLKKADTPQATSAIDVTHRYYGTRRLFFEGAPELLFTDNETNWKRLTGGENESRFVKDGINEFVVHGATDAVNAAAHGTKAAGLCRLLVGPGETKTLRLRFLPTEGVPVPTDPFGPEFDETLEKRKREADLFYDGVVPKDLSDDARDVMRQSLGGMLWSKQFFHYDVARWLKGDPDAEAPPKERLRGRNSEWTHLYNSDVISMPDKWEYPWYAAWDLAFHCVALALVDPDFAKQQLLLLLREWYMHPNGQLPAYEWAFGDVNPPVHAWAAWRVYQIERSMHGRADRAFLESVFHKLMLNFTWWVNRKDAAGKNVFQGGFLGLDNIGVFDRSNALPNGSTLEQADATSWMGMYCLNLLEIALELARENQSYEDVANKFFEHFLLIAKAANLGDETGGGMAGL
ncbi:MAG TPA: glucosidase, partial [Thermoanaerobaculia bacterium]|nr:glucosidase [Thermoanaerobaculia bacterium]